MNVLVFMTMIITRDCNCDCGLLNGSGVVFLHTHLDRFPHAVIIIESGTTFRYANILALNSMRGSFSSLCPPLQVIT